MVTRLSILRREALPRNQVVAAITIGIKANKSLNDRATLA
jgi:hypothetical protein